MPAWRERDGKRLPLLPGMELRAVDRIISGKDARVVMMKLSEGSLVRLGENGSLRFTELEPSRTRRATRRERARGAGDDRRARH